MRERKYVKFRVDMLSDTKSKIIDKKPERDLIHYIWMALVLLAGKVNMEGNLYMSRNLPYTIETLAIEFNRSEEQIKLALEIFIELEMLELIDGRIYRVKNFSKHQNIKVKEKINLEDKENKIKNTNENELKNAKAVTKEDSQIEIPSNEVKKSDNKDKESEINVAEKEIPISKNDDKENQEIINTEINKMNNMSSEIIDNSFKNDILISLETRKNKKGKGKKKKEEVFIMKDEEDIEDNEIISFTEEERPLGEGERVILKMTFNEDNFTEEYLC
ncbi:phage replisome organizer N-terminal domain-containing protein [Clostridium sp. C2-6-12]|jgi:predicted phage replisome organizer|uniref:phage replisome organizer N-terminal domain-containing protein n=1 Tax=Clostridium sp. C2-6-12 TaxID=2698832 RepID=UPI00136C4566|nr:phage replisome organizer N-terminal domain-containing protein [Clostridium sp. C2-6-12]